MSMRILSHPLAPRTRPRRHPYPAAPGPSHPAAPRPRPPRRRPAAFRGRLAAFLAAGLVVAGCAGVGGGGGSQGQAENYPSDTLQWTVAFGPGGGNDIMSRTLADILEKENLYPEDIVITNREGGSGAKGWGHLFNQAGDPYQISTTSGSFITTPLQADTGWGPSDFTPVALLAADYLLFLVPPDGPTSLEEFVAQAKNGKPAIGGIGTVNVDFIVNSLLAEQAGYEFDYVPFDDEGQLISALLSGSLDAIVSNPAEVLGQVEAGKMRALAFTGDERIPSLSEVPTLDELGYPMDIAMPRGLILPPDVPKEAQQWWIATMKKVVETPEWQDYIEKNQLVEKLAWGQDFESSLAETSGTFEEILREQGAIE